MFLDFMGLRLEDEDTGKVARAEGWEDRFLNLEQNGHNNLRITRVLVSMAEFGFEHYQAPLIRLLFAEALEHRTLAACEDSLCNFWVHVILDDSCRSSLISEIERSHSHLIDC